MGRRKQSRPHRSGWLIIKNNVAPEEELERLRETDAEPVKEELLPFFVEADRDSWSLDEHLDLSEIILSDLHLREGHHGFRINEDFFKETKYSLRFSVRDVEDSIHDRIKLGHWPVLSSGNISLEIIDKCIVEDGEIRSIILSGSFDGPDDGITGLIHLTSIRFLTLRPVLGVELSEQMTSLRVRVEMLKSAFDACSSLLENTRQTWKKSMMSVVSWLRPEVMTSEARYGITKSRALFTEFIGERDDESNTGKQPRFDVAGFYEAIRPSKSDPMLEDALPDLLPVLRPYQRRAAYWMIQQEKGNSETSGGKDRNRIFSPLSVPVEFLDTCTKMFYNPFSGSVSLHSELSSPHLFGGILADEMGLGKTLELLACIFAHRKSASESNALLHSEDEQVNLRRVKKERVECVCGAVTESYKYGGLWVQCDICDAWQHADCVGYSPRGKKKKSMLEVEKHRKKTKISFIERDGKHICQMCSELMQATDSPIATGATLIVCPAPILPQWQAEIARHTRVGSLKTYIYEGVREASLSNSSAVDISEFVRSDIVLTTYDVLKEDLSHDSDRHEGDRHSLRFQKRYPVIPTLLTRIFWWRVCLDEGQMVESNTAAATEMALRLSAKHRWCITGTPIQRKLDDLYGLLRFLKASPFNVSRWWVDVIRDPYERRDAEAMEFTHRFFKAIMWRSSKTHVADELQLPPQEECISWLTFSAIEKYFYQRQHETSLVYVREVIESLKDDILNKKFPEAAKLLSSLLKLRQACCHPQVGSSGLRTLQQSPMTMQEVLMVLVSKTKIEGEEALRKSVIALNALAGIAIIEKNFSQAVLLYKEALALTEEYSEDFDLDTLLNIHILHNLSEILPMVTDFTSLSNGEQLLGSSAKATKTHRNGKGDLSVVKKRKIDGDGSEFITDAESLQGVLENCLDEDQKGDICGVASRLNGKSLRGACDNLKHKYLSAFHSKLSIAQQDFRKSYTQVRDEYDKTENQHSFWWLDALHHAEENENFSRELIRKIDEAVSGTLNNSRSSRVSSRFRSIKILQYYIQTHLDQLKASRKALLGRLLEIDQSMEKPKEEDIERVRCCRICQSTKDGPICIHCELDGLFQDYEARLFRLNKSHGEVISSAEEAVDLQKKNSARNRFFSNLYQEKKNSSSSVNGDDGSRKRNAVETVMVSKSPSELEVVLGIIKNHCKVWLGKEGASEASQHLHILEGMRKEYSHARFLAISQAHYLRAHDEIKMATSRLHLREDENDMSIDALAPEDLEPASVLHSCDKFMSLTLLSRIRGKLRYLKGLVLSKQKSLSENLHDSSTQEISAMSMTTEKISDGLSKYDEEACPICHEKLNNQKMVFQCGHFTCCKCLFAMTEQTLQDNKLQHKWVMCPTCRQHSDFHDIAYADDRLEKSGNSATLAFQECERFEASLTVQGSYGTKIEAVTRRILSIRSSDPNSKILVFSSWNDVLDVLEHAFNSNDITYVRMKGGRKSHVAISEFRGQKSSSKGIHKVDGQQRQKSIQVLLLLIQHGANGLNLLEAQHVVLVEPLLNPAAEAQAISRVHRIGQENRTLVHRFIVKDTVEESIYKLNRRRDTTSFVSGNTKNQDQPALTLKDVESLFATMPTTAPGSEEDTSESLRHLPPSVAAALAAERRLKANAA